MLGELIIAGIFAFLLHRVLTRTVLPELRQQPLSDRADGDCFPEPVLRGDFKAFHSTPVTEGGQQDHV